MKAKLKTTKTCELEQGGIVIFGGSADKDIPAAKSSGFCRIKDL